MGKATRAAFGEALVRIGETHPRVVVIDGDLSCSTQTGKFAAAFPERFIQLGIAEGNMVSVAAGMALGGMVPFAASFACFIAGRFEQVRISVGYNNANVTIVGTHSGVGIGEDGYSQMGLEDVALMRSLPNMVVIQPADAAEAGAATEFLADYVGPAYLRLTRQSVPDIFDDRYRFEFGKGVILREGSDLSIVAGGGVVANALEAAERLSQEGLSVGVVNMHTIKPIDLQLLEELAASTGKIMTVEDHSVIGGLGGAVVEALAETSGVSIRIHGVHGYGESGSHAALYAKHLLDSQGIAQVAKDFILPVGVAKAAG
ncbi:MAG: transketolase C-terminal domain-containing protein [Deltaproteobacteria bacterium]